MNKNFFCIITFLVVAFAATAQSMPKNIKKLLNAQYAISAFYVDSINEDKVVEDAIKGILNELDPHSAYSTAEETKELNEPLAGKFSGIDTIMLCALPGEVDISSTQVRNLIAQNADLSPFMPRNAAQHLHILLHDLK